MPVPDGPSDPTFERTTKLPDEILQAQQSRSDLLKWKLVITALLGAAGFGLSEKATPAPLLLALIPFACLYVDLLCHNLSIRQIMIGRFYAKMRNDPYEQFVADSRHNDVFSMEDWALTSSTVLVCLSLLLVGFVLAVQSTSPAHDRPGQVNAASLSTQPATSPATPVQAQPEDNNSWPPRQLQGIVIMITSVGGLILSMLVGCRNHTLRHRIE
jgi:hypothetical protein